MVKNTTATNFTIEIVDKPHAWHNDLCALVWLAQRPASFESDG